MTAAGPRRRRPAPPPPPSGVACPHYPDCPGCPWVGRPYADQLAAKRVLVRDALAGALAPAARPEVQPVIAAPATTGYRVQVKLMVHGARTGPVLGLYGPGTHRVFDASRCPLHDPALQRAIPAVRDALQREDVPLHGRWGAGVRYVLLRASVSEGRVLATLVSSRVPLPGVARVARRLRAALPLAGLLVNENRSAGNVIVGARTTRIWGEHVLRDRFGTLVLAAGPTAFVQANARMAARIYAAIGASTAPGSRVLDLYCGVGGIALTLAREASAVLGIEEVEPAVRAARENARRNELRARFEHGRVEDLVRDVARGAVDLVTMNPPRRGCGPDVARALARLNAPRILYLSCSPASFARDAAALGDGGYALRAVQPFDMMPHTDQVELLGTFERF